MNNDIDPIDIAIDSIFGDRAKTEVRGGSRFARSSCPHKNDVGHPDPGNDVYARMREQELISLTRIVRFFSCCNYCGYADDPYWVEFRK